MQLLELEKGDGLSISFRGFKVTGVFETYTSNGELVIRDDKDSKLTIIRDCQYIKLEDK